MKNVIANFKSNKTRDEYQSWMDEFEKRSGILSSDLQVILAPAYPDLMFFSNRLADASKHPRTSLATQDLSPFPAGAYTGAVSTHVLRGFSIRFCILGHSERRRYFHETPQDIANKVREALQASIQPIVCVSDAQITSTAAALSPDERTKVWVAFEPIEHIGTGTSDSLAHILETKERVSAAFGEVPYIYGGSVHKDSDPDILHSPKIDGFLVGSACLDPEGFTLLLERIALGQR